MIPDFNHSHVLPPYLGAPTSEPDMAPYEASMSELVARFATSLERIEILHGLIAYRRKMRGIGIARGFQWIDGSFAEDVEKLRSRPPSDIDIVTFAYRPETHFKADAWARLWAMNDDLFVPLASKESYKCDAYFVDLELSSVAIVRRTRFWFGLFSHQKITDIWKGLVQVPLESDDTMSVRLLREAAKQYA